MEKINELLAVLENTVPAKTKARLDKFSELKAEQVKAIQEKEANPTEENTAYIVEIEEAITEFEEDLIEELNELIEAKNQPAVVVETPASNTAKPTETTTVETKKEEKEDESSVSVFGLVFGGILLIASVGAINYFRKK